MELIKIFYIQESNLPELISLQPWPVSTDNAIGVVRTEVE